MNTTIEERLITDGYVVTVLGGSSMRPFMTERIDPVVIQRCESAPKKGQVILYRRDDGVLVLHRILRVLPDGFLTRGDACVRGEYTIKPQQVLGVMLSYEHHGRHIDCASRGYRFRCFAWKLAYPVRFSWKLFCRFLKHNQ